MPATQPAGAGRRLVPPPTTSRAHVAGLRRGSISILIDYDAWWRW